MIGDGTSHAKELVSSFTYPSSPTQFPYNISSTGKTYLLTFKFIDTDNEYSLANFHKGMDNVRAIVLVINILTSANWKSIASKIDGVIEQNHIQRVPGFIIGTKFMDSSGGDEEPTSPGEVASSYSEIFGNNVDSTRNCTTDASEITPIVATEEVLKYVDSSKFFELYLETEYGMYAGSDDQIEAKIVIDPIIRAIIRLDHESYKREFLAMQKRRSRSSSLLLCFMPSLAGDDLLDEEPVNNR